MVSELIVTHYKKGSLEAPHWSAFSGFQSTSVWETCIRVLGLSLQSDPKFDSAHALEDVQTYRGSQAYHFLLRIAAGLESPILGETEVFGQFKNWLEENPKWQTLGKMILEDVKLVRRQFLEGLGAQSYGSWARKKLENQSHVMMIGCGQLGQEILPWLSKSDRHVEVVVRNVESYKQFQKPYVQILTAEQVQEWSGALLILAPLSEDELKTILAKSNFKLVVDLRDVSGKFWSGQKAAQPVHTLEDAFNDLKKFRELGQSQILSAEKKLLELSHLRTQTVQNRPFGWDDLCL